MLASPDDHRLKPSPEQPDQNPQLAVGDEAFQRKCFARIEQIRERGATILFVSHAAQTIIQLCDRAVLLDGGEKLMEGTPKTVAVEYQRLAMASATGTVAIREELARKATRLYTQEDHGTVSNTNRLETPQSTTPGDFFDPSLEAKSVIEFERRGAVISGLRIERITGEQVNILKGGVRYTLRYEVRFSHAVDQVGFSYSIRTRTGLALCGASTYAHDSFRLPRVEVGSLVRVEFEFETILNPDIYFLSCSVRGKINNDDVILHKVDDALAFRILPEEIRLATFHVDIGTTHRVEVETEFQEPMTNKRHD